MTLWIDTRLIEAQMPMIKKLEEDIEREERQIRYYTDLIAKSQPKADFYLDMQSRIIDNPHVMEAWQVFMMLIKFTLDEKVKGITHD